MTITSTPLLEGQAACRSQFLWNGFIIYFKTDKPVKIEGIASPLCDRISALQTATGRSLEDCPGRDSLLQESALHNKEELEKVTACWKPERGGSVDAMLTEETWPTTSNLWDHAPSLRVFQ